MSARQTKQSQNMAATVSSPNTSGLILANRHTHQGALGFMFIFNGEIYATGLGGNTPFVDKNTAYGFHTIPVNNPSDSPFVELSYNYHCAYARTAAGEVYSWGTNPYGSLGHGDKKSCAVPTKIQWFEDNDVQIAELIGAPVHSKGIDITCMHFLGTNGQIYGCGYNAYGQLGVGDTKDRAVPTAALFPSGPDKKAIMISKAYVNSPVYTSVYAISNTGQLYVWGMNDRGHLGIGNTTNQDTPQKVATFTNVVDVKAALNDEPNTYGSALLLTAEGTLWGTGGNYFGELGLDNTTTPYINWTQEVLGKTDWRWFDLGAGNCSIAIDKENNFYVAGMNNYGQVGDGTVTNATKFTKPMYAYPGAALENPENSGAALGFQGKAAYGMVTGSHYEATIAVVSTDGKMWTSGNGEHGIRATGVRVSGDKPGDHRYFTQVPMPTSGAKIVALKTTGHTRYDYGWIVQLEDGRLLGAGDNRHGQLGLENDIDTISYFTEIWRTPVGSTRSKAHFRGEQVEHPTEGTTLPLSENLFLQGGSISRNDATITLQPGRTYKLTGKARLKNKTGNFRVDYQFKEVATGNYIGDFGSQILVPSTLHASAYPEAIAYISPSVVTEVELCITHVTGNGTVKFSQVEVDEVS